MKGWQDIWSEVRTIVKASGSRASALRKVSEVKDQFVTWDALQRAWTRYEGDSISRHLGEGPYNPSIPSLAAVDPLGDAIHQWLPRSDTSLVPVSQQPSPPAPKPRKHLVIPDTQVRPGVPTEHFRAIGRYIVDKGPDVVIHLGDHWDMPSLSGYESPVRRARLGRCKQEDIKAGNQALELIEEELAKANFQPKQKVLLEGNHDGFASQGRVGRFLDEHPEDIGLVAPHMFADSWLGWDRIPFEKTIVIDGVHYSHLFPLSSKGTMTSAGRRMGASSAAVQVRNNMVSCTAGHKPGLDIHLQHTPKRTYRGLIAGSCYLHEEEFLGPQRYWRGILVKHEVSLDNPNHYSLMEVSLDYLMRRYAQ